jgi:hypothetical protein
MTVVVDSFEVVPEPQQAERPSAQSAPATQTAPQLARQVEATIRTLQARRARLRAT